MNFFWQKNECRYKVVLIKPLFQRIWRIWTNQMFLGKSWFQENYIEIQNSKTFFQFSLLVVWFVANALAQILVENKPHGTWALTRSQKSNSLPISPSHPALFVGHNASNMKKCHARILLINQMSDKDRNNQLNQREYVILLCFYFHLPFIRKVYKKFMRKIYNFSL